VSFFFILLILKVNNKPVAAQGWQVNLSGGDVCSISFFYDFFLRGISRGLQWMQAIFFVRHSRSFWFNNTYYQRASGSLQHPSAIDTLSKIILSGSGFFSALI